MPLISGVRARVGLACGAAAACVILALAGASIAEACGGMFRARQLSPEQRPSLSREKVLLIHDAERGRQHFVREVAFARATEPFGFVVPTPTRPEVEGVKITPFSKLRLVFPFERVPIPRGGGGGGGDGSFGRGGGGGVTVLEQKAVGSFTAFVLAASDAQALAKWLADNELVSSPEADRWLAHYVALDFYYVAMRYDPERADSSDAAAPAKQRAVIAETMRISFDTPLPYYPYLEPEAPPGLAQDEPRLMELWYVGRDAVTPVAVREQDGRRQWVRPLAEGLANDEARALLTELLEPELRELLPGGGELVVQTFQDQKRDRRGFEDIVFAHQQAQELSAEQRAALEPMLALLDPELVPAAADEQAQEVAP